MLCLSRKGSTGGGAGRTASRRGQAASRRIVAAFTGGDSDNLMVGRNGLFFDRKGRDWDATITKIIDNPISIRQAFFAPYKKLVRMIEEQVAKPAEVPKFGTSRAESTSGHGAVHQLSTFWQTNQPACAQHPETNSL